MRSAWTAATAAALLALWTAPATAQQEPGAAPPDSGVSFDFQDADLRAVLSSLAEAAGLSIVYSDLPSRSVTLRTARSVPPDEIADLLETVAEANDLVLEREGGIVRVAADGSEDAGRTDTLRADRVRRGGDRPRLYVHRLQHADAETVARTLQALFGMGRDGGVASAPQDGRAALSESLREQRTAGYRSMERQDDGARAADGGDGLQAAAGGRDAGDEGLHAVLEAPAELVPDTRSNALLVMATPADNATIESAIEKLDVRPLQVVIEVLIAEVRQDDEFALGNTVDVPPSGDDDGVGFELQGLSAGDVALRVLGIGSVGASAVLSALSSTSDVTILSRPVVMAQNNQEARIMVGDQRPFVQLERSLPTDASVRDRVVQYRNVGTELRIRPTINRDGYVNLSVLQEVSSATAEVQFGAPVINTRESETQVLVKDGHTAVLGGLVDHQEERIRSGVPLFKDIPVLGGLFGTTRTRERATELFILLTPRVLRTDADLESVRRELEASTDELGDRMPSDRTLVEPPPGDVLPFPDTVPRPPSGGEPDEGSDRRGDDPTDGGPQGR